MLAPRIKAPKVSMGNTSSAYPPGALAPPLHPQSTLKKMVMVIMMVTIEIVLAEVVMMTLTMLLLLLASSLRQ